MDYKEFFDEQFEKMHKKFEQLSDEEKNKKAKEAIGVSIDELKDLSESDQQILINSLIGNLEVMMLEHKKEMYDMIEGMVQNPLMKPLIKPIIEGFLHFHAQYYMVAGQVELESKAREHRRNSRNKEENS